VGGFQPSLGPRDRASRRGEPFRVFNNNITKSQQRVNPPETGCPRGRHGRATEPVDGVLSVSPLRREFTRSCREPKTWDWPSLPRRNLRSSCLPWPLRTGRVGCGIDRSMVESPRVSVVPKRLSLDSGQDAIGFCGRALRI
jgi:hypothetical protein